MKNKYVLIFSSLFFGLNVYAQNVGVGTSTPAEKLHIAGSLRADDLQTPVPTAAASDKVVWVDANGKVYSFPTGAIGKVLGVNGAGVLAWLNPGLSNSLNNGQIWVGDPSNAPVPQTASGDALISNTGVITIQDNAVDGTDISISAESNGSLMYFDGTDWVNLGVGTAGQILTISGGVPAWVSPAAASVTGNLTTATSGLTVTGGTGAVLGAGTTVNVATNALNQNGLVTGPTAGNALQVWGTDALGNPGWVDPSSLVDVDNGLYYNGVAGKIRQGGALVENTTITQGAFNYLHALSGVGVFEARNSATAGNGLYVAPSDRVGIGTAVPASKLDILGDLALREGAAIAVAAGSNALTLTGEFSHYRLTGAAGAFAINTIVGGNDGQVLTLINAATQAMTINNNNAANGILTGSGANLISTGTGNSSVTLIYNATLARWVVKSSSGMLDANDWHLTGNAGTNAATNFIGTTDNIDFVTKTNNTERLRVLNDGRIKVGVGGTNFKYGLSRMEIEGEGVQPHISYVSDYPSFIMMRHNGTLAAPTNLANGDNVGELRWYGYNTSTYYQTARILSYVDGAPVANSIPGSLNFMTNTAGNSVTDEKMIIKNDGKVGIGTFAMGGPLAKLHVFATGANWNLVGTNGDFYVGDATYRFKLGVATGGAGAGDAYLSSNGGTNRIFIGGAANSQILTVNGTSNNVAVNLNGAIAINSRLDVNGDLALREGTAIAVVAGSNAVALTGENSHYRLTGAAGAFAVNTLTGGNDGQLLTLINAATQTMTINNNNAANGILTGSGVNLVSNGTGNSSVTMIYNATLARWVVKSSSGMADANDWHITGNVGTSAATNFVGTTDNVDFVMRTNNTEKMRVNTAGQVGIGTAFSPIGSTYGFEKLKISGDANVNDVELEAIGGGGFGAFIVFNKANGTYAAIPTRTIVGNGDQLAHLQFNGYDGIGYRPAAHFIVSVDGTPGANDMPTRMEFYTTPDGTVSNLERMRINNAGNIGINNSAPAYRLDVNGTIRAIDFGVAGSQNVIVGDDAFLTDVDLANFTGIYGVASASAQGGLYLGNVATSYLYGNGGNIGINTTAPGARLDVEQASNNANAIYGINNAAAGASTGIGVYAQTAQSTGLAVYARNLNTTGTGVLGAGNGLGGNYLTVGSGGAFTGTGVGAVFLATTAGTGNGIVSSGNNLGFTTFTNGTGASLKGFDTGVGSIFTTGGIGRAYYGQDNFGAFWNIGYWSGTAYFKIIGNGMVSTVVKDVNEKPVVMACPEAPEVLFMDMGAGQLVNGKVHITIDPNFAKNIVVNAQHSLRVFVQLEGESKGVFVSNKTANGFDVQELDGGNNNTPFTWQIYANRADETMESGRVARYADLRFSAAPTKLETVEQESKQVNPVTIRNTEAPVATDRVVHEEVTPKEDTKLNRKTDK